MQMAERTFEPFEPHVQNFWGRLFEDVDELLTPVVKLSILHALDVLLHSLSHLRSDSHGNPAVSKHESFRNYGSLGTVYIDGTYIRAPVNVPVGKRYVACANQVCMHTFTLIIISVCTVYILLISGAWMVRLHRIYIYICIFIHILCGLPLYSHVSLHCCCKVMSSHFEPCYQDKAAQGHLSFHSWM